jgi:hypothetical protein
MERPLRDFSVVAESDLTKYSARDRSTDHPLSGRERGNVIEEIAMDKIRAWLKRLSPGSTSSNTAQTQDPGQSARTTRAEHVTELQAKVSSLQQEILALSNAAGGSTAGDTRGGGNAQMAALERQLDEAQRELAKYQGRI